MAETVDDAGSVKSFLAENFTQVVHQKTLVLPVADILHYIFHHPLYFLVGAAVERPFHGAEGCCNGGVGVGLCRCDHMVCECGVVTAAVLCMEYKGNVQDRRLKFCVLCVGPDHPQEVGCCPDLGCRSVQEKALAIMVVGLCLISVGNHGREPGNKLYALPQDIAYRDVIGVGVVGVGYQHAPGQFVHHIPAGGFEYHILGKAGRQLSAFIQGAVELLKLLCGRKSAEKEEECCLLETVSFFLYSIGDQVVDQDTAVGKSTFVRNQGSLIKYITMGITDLGKPHHHSGAVFVSQAALGVVL